MAVGGDPRVHLIVVRIEHPQSVTPARAGAREESAVAERLPSISIEGWENEQPGASSGDVAARDRRRECPLPEPGGPQLGRSRDSSPRLEFAYEILGRHAPRLAGAE